jgi:hypothetical protein
MIVGPPDKSEQMIVGPPDKSDLFREFVEGFPTKNPNYLVSAITPLGCLTTMLSLAQSQTHLQI